MEHKERTPEKPVRTARAERPKRVPISGTRDLLTVEGKDPNFHYRWFSDKNETGQRIHRAKLAGYELVLSEEVRVGDAAVFKSSNVGSIVRVPDGRSGNYLYLMKLPQEWREEDLQDRANRNKETENLISQTRDEGQYGEVKISRQ
jgi:hypothetical protein